MKYNHGPSFGESHYVATSVLLCTLLIAGQSLVANDFIPTVVVGNPGNQAKEVSAATGLLDPRWFKSGNFGSVPYQYRIGTTEVTNDQYAVFLNAVAGSNRRGLFDERMEDDPRGGIIRSGENGNYEYATKPLMGNKPVVYVTYYDSLRFANWMHNGMPSGTPNLDQTATEDGAYSLLGRTFPQLFDQDISRNPDAQWFLPSEDEWYKAAYHMNDGVTGNYYDYPTSSNDVPSIASADEFGDVLNPGNNVANYERGADWNGQDGNLTSVGSAGSVSAYGTFDQAGNVDEWTDTVIWTGSNGGPGGYRYFPIVRGGTFFQVNDFHNVGLAAGTRDVGGPGGNVDHIGFRVATAITPEPGDFNLDGTVDIRDVDVFEYGNQIGLTDSDIGFNPAMDLDNNGLIDLADHDQFIETLLPDVDGPGALVGDLNLDGDIDISQLNVSTQNVGDASVLLANLGTTQNATYAQGDLNADGDIDISQFQDGMNVGDASRLLANLNQPFSSAVATSNAVPEPSSTTMLAIVAAAASCLRRRNRNSS